MALGDYLQGGNYTLSEAKQRYLAGLRGEMDVAFTEFKRREAALLNAIGFVAADMQVPKGFTLKPDLTEFVQQEPTGMEVTTH